MVLERWNLQGEMTIALERRVEWLPPNGYPPLNDPMEPRLPEYDLLHLDDNGLLWVAVAVRDPRWRQVEGRQKQEQMDELYDARLEVVDLAAGTVVASFRRDSLTEELPPFARFISGRRAFRVTEDDAGFRSIEIYDISLVQK